MVVAVPACNKPATVGVQPATPKYSSNPTPEESFALIVETFRRGVEDVSIGFRVPREGGHSMLAGKNKVTHEIVPPTKEGEPYKAYIIVSSLSRYSIQRSADRPEEQSREADSGQQEARNLFEGDKDPNDIGILDADLAGNSKQTGRDKRPAVTSNEETVQSRNNQSDRKYELIYERGRWSLVTKLDPETEQGIQFAFEYALKSQI